MSSESAAVDARIAALKAELKALNASKPRTLTCKVSAKGALSIYGLGRFPVTLYASQFDQLAENFEAIKAFRRAHSAELTVKAEAVEA